MTLTQDAAQSAEPMDPITAMLQTGQAQGWGGGAAADGSNESKPGWLVLQAEPSSAQSSLAAKHPNGICAAIVAASFNGRNALVPQTAAAMDGDTYGVIPSSLQRNGEAEAAELSQLVAEAQRSYKTAENSLLKDGLPLCEDWLRMRDLFFSAGSLFAIVGDTASSARALLHATFINRAFHNDDEALTTLAMSVDQLTHAHPALATESLIRLARCYEAKGLLYQAARSRRDAAELLEAVLGDKSAAVVQYVAAIDTYGESTTVAEGNRRMISKYGNRWMRRNGPPTAPSFIHVTQRFSLLDEAAWIREQHRILQLHLIEESEGLRVVGRETARLEAAMEKIKSSPSSHHHHTVVDAAAAMTRALHAQTVVSASHYIEEHPLLYHHPIPPAVEQGGRPADSDANAAVADITAPPTSWLSSLHQCNVTLRSGALHGEVRLQQGQPTAQMTVAGGAPSHENSLPSGATETKVVQYGVKSYLDHLNSALELRHHFHSKQHQHVRSTGGERSGPAAVSVPPTPLPADGALREGAAAETTGAPVSLPSTQWRRVAEKSVRTWRLPFCHATSLSTHQDDAAGTAPPLKTTTTTSGAPTLSARTPPATPQWHPVQTTVDAANMSDLFTSPHHPSPLPCRTVMERLQEEGKDAIDGFDALGRYLHALDTDESLVEVHQFFDWWREEDMQRWGGVFLQHLFHPHPICSICADALLKRNEAKEDEDNK